ncbi:MAG TPA: hypothetical protein VFY34_04545, partial [Pyrinomonadaceae bacterium]|nr:hypothetical protein [Pyrinomonadaceae bacterium]
MVFAFWAGVLGVSSAAANDPWGPKVKISVSSPAEVRIRIESLSPSTQWSFLNAYAGAVGLGERIEQFRAYAPGG